MWIIIFTPHDSFIFYFEGHCACDRMVVGFTTTYADRWFSADTPVSSTNKNDYHDIAEILLKVASNTITLTLYFDLIFKVFIVTVFTLVIHEGYIIHWFLNFFHILDTSVWHFNLTHYTVTGISRYCTVHVYVVIQFCHSMWSFWVETNLKQA